MAVEPEQKGERRVEVEVDAEPELLMGYHRPDMNDPDGAALEVVTDILGSGRTSRFYRAIVEKSKIATGVWSSASGPGERDPNLFLIGGTPQAPHTTGELEQAIEKEIALLMTAGPTEMELKKIKNNAIAGVIHGLASNQGMANQLAYYESVGGDWTRLISDIEDIKKVSADDVKRVLKKYLIRSNKTIAVLVKKK